jgi:acetyl esterase/lipase
MADEQVSLEEGVRYGSGGGQDLLCDIYRPPKGAPETGAAVVLVHGGSWRGGDRTQLRRYGWRLGRAGYLCVAISYRLIPETWFPGFLHDVKAAIRWTRANAADLGVEPGRIGIHGNSAGGHLALLAAGTGDVTELEGSGGNAGVSSGVSACVSVYGPSLFHLDEPLRGSRPAGRVIEEPTPESAKAASPISWVSPSFPPTCLLHGVADALVPVAASELMYEALGAAGVPAELHLYPDQPHGFDAAAGFARQNAAIVSFFLDRYLARPEETEETSRAGSAGVGAGPS